MNDQELRLTPAHAAEEFQGAVLGITTTLFAWVALALVAGIALFVWLFEHRRLTFFEAFLYAALPLIGVLFFLLAFHVNKPPGYASDLIDSLLIGGHAVPPHQPPLNPFHDR